VRLRNPRVRHWHLDAAWCSALSPNPETLLVDR